METDSAANPTTPSLEEELSRAVAHAHGLFSSAVPGPLAKQVCDCSTLTPIQSDYWFCCPSLFPEFLHKNTLECRV